MSFDVHRSTALLIVALAPLGCDLGALADSESPALASASDPVVYGVDDRRDAPSSGRWSQALENSVVALIRGGRLRATEGGSVAVASMTLAEKYAVCAGEPFARQPTAASCGGILIDDDLVLTAGHCFADDATCDQYAYVFGYVDAGEGVELDEGAVFGCRDILVRRVDVAPGSHHVDYAIVQLDRPVHAPSIAVRDAAPVVGEGVWMVGFPSGLPAKLDDGGVVLSTAADHFQATLDAFLSNSGSPVFDASGALLGLLVAGASGDYVPNGDCWTSRSVPADEIAQNGAERVVLPGLALDELCASGHPTPRLCPSTHAAPDPAAQSPVRCRGLDCTANDFGETEMLPRLDSSTPEVPEAPEDSREPACALSGHRSGANTSAIWIVLLGFALAVRRRAAGRSAPFSSLRPSGVTTTDRAKERRR